MKYLILIRHAKSSRENFTADFERDLTEKGIINSIKISNSSIDYVDSNSCIWSSPAKRAFETAKIIVGNWKIDVNLIQQKNALYTFNLNELEKIVKSCPNECNNLILFGHNDAITDFVNKFGDLFIENVPTSGFVSIFFNTNSWNSIDKGKINKILFPRDL